MTSGTIRCREAATAAVFITARCPPATITSLTNGDGQICLKRCGVWKSNLARGTPSYHRCLGTKTEMLTSKLTAAIKGFGEDAYEQVGKVESLVH